MRAYTGLRRHNDDVVLHKITDIIRGIRYPLSATLRACSGCDVCTCAKASFVCIDLITENHADGVLIFH